MTVWPRVLLRRILKSTGFWGSIAFALAMAAASRGHGGATSVLPGGVGAFVLPVAVFSAMNTASERRGTRGLIGLPLSFGQAPGRSIAQSAGSLIAFSILTSASLGLLVALVAHSAVDPPLATDLVRSAWALGVAGGAYASLFLFAGSYGKRGGGAQLALMADFIFGGSDTSLARWLPRAHVQRVLGGDAIVDWSNHASMAALCTMAAVLFACLTLRARQMGRGALTRQPA
jgi:hypothetical protein